MTETTGTAEEYKRLHDGGLTYQQIADQYHVSRQSVQNMVRRTYGAPGRRAVRKSKDSVHMAEVRVKENVHAAATARLASIIDQLKLVGSSKPTLAAICREIIQIPLSQSDFPKLPQPFASSPPGSMGGAAQVVRWRDNWGRYSAAQRRIHRRGYSVSEVIDKRLEQFARSGELPGQLRHHQTGDEK